MGADLVGTKLGHFRIVEKIGEGGMGVVFKAIDEELHRAVAVKILSVDFAEDDERRRRFLREARVAAGLNHPNITTVYEVGEIDGRIYIAMELVDGRSLRDRLESGALDVTIAIRIAKDLARALIKAHESGIVHRDLKPDNVMVNDDLAVKVLDFGLAKPLDEAVSTAELENLETASQMTAEGRILGTPGYMSPEQTTGKGVDARTDIFALGVVLYEMVTGMRPFRGASVVDIIVATNRDEPESPSKLRESIGPDVERVILRCLEKKPEARFATARALLSDLETLDTVSVPSALSALRPRRWVKAVLALAIAAGAVVLVVPAIGRRQVAVPAPAASVASIRGMTVVEPGTITNPEAIAAFRAGLQSLRDASWTEATPQFEKAVKIEPAFGAAWLRLGVIRRLDIRPTADESFRQAMRFRATMTERDRALLDALAPWLDGTGNWGPSQAAVQRLLQRFPRDVEILDFAIFGLPGQPGSDELLALAREGLSLDPEALDFYQAEADALSPLGRVDEAIEALDRGVAIAPNATDLLWTRAGFQNGMGHCREAERDARTSLARGGAEYAAGFLAAAMFANGEPRIAVERTIAQAVTYPVYRDLPGRLDVATGELVTAERRLREALVAAGGDRFTHSFSTSLLVQLLLELGRVADAALAAETYRNSSAAFHGELSPSDDPTLFLASVEVRAGTLPRGAFGAIRDRWLAKEREAMGSTQSTEIWTAAYAMPAATPEEASASLSAGGKAPALSPAAYSLRWDGESPRAAMGTLRFLAGDYDGALPYLRAVAASCDALFVPVRWLHAHHDLGVILEAKGDRAGACAAYKVVVDRWGNAKPPTITGTDSRKRAKALGCP